MKYILMMNTMQAGDPPLAGWSPQAIQAHIAFMMQVNRDLSDAGELISAEGLAFPDQARLVRAGDNGEPVTDGVFPESREFLAGFWIVDVDSAERAYAIGARISSAPGPQGKPLRMPVEVRPVMSAPPVDLP